MSTRVNVYSYDSYDGPQLVGWFGAKSADVFDEATYWDGSNYISQATDRQFEHQTLYRTKAGRWVLQNWSQWQDRAARHEFVDASVAQDWLLGNGHDAAVVEHFGPVADEHGPELVEVGADKGKS